MMHTGNIRSRNTLRLCKDMMKRYYCMTEKNMSALPPMKERAGCIGRFYVFL
ncbi:hypothetical protein [Parablautia muri]|uniref:hypothetical protein n=1 Tax=Parablautia muri TaxID=2320879 RepID=UPI0013720D41|nr:hypothetical protein [Parablautia muri]